MPDNRGNPTVSPLRRWGFAVSLVLYGLLLLLTKPVPLNHDELAYMLMARELADHHTLLYHNAPYEEISYSDPGTKSLFRFAHPLIRDFDMKQMAFKYPPVDSIVAYPFFKLWSYEGMLLLNALSFVLTLYFIRRIALLLFASEAIAVASCLVFMLGTFSWFYSLTFLVHAPAVMLQAAGAYLAFCSYKQRGEKGSRRDIFIAGLLLAIAGGIRYDALLLLPALLLPFLFIRPIPWSYVVCGLLGILLISPLYAITNYFKFNLFHPYTYGEAISNFNYAFVPFIFAGLLIVFIFEVRKYASLPARWQPYQWPIFISAALVGGVLMLWVSPYSIVQKGHADTFFAFVATLIGAIFNQIVDGRIGIDFYNYMSEGSTAGMGLLQSCPHLMLLLWFAVNRKQWQQHKTALMLLAVAIAVPLLVISGLGMCSYIHPLRRLLLSVFPFTSILCGVVLCQLWSRRWQLVPLLAFVAGFIVFWFTLKGEVMDARALAMRETPLWIAGGIALCLLLLPRVEQGFAAMITLSFAWSAALSGSFWFEDMQRRQKADRQYDAIHEYLTPGSLVATRKLQKEQLFLYLPPDVIYLQTYDKNTHIKNAWNIMRRVQASGHKTYFLTNWLAGGSVYSAAPLTLRAAKDGMLFLEVETLPPSTEDDSGREE